MKAELQVKAKNILGTELELCCNDPKTGFFRDGYCNTNQMDAGTHVVCAIVTSEFLEFTRSKGNDLTTSRPDLNFPGLKHGDGWCLCALRWQEAFNAGCAPLIKPTATHERALQILDIKDLQKHFIKQ